MVLLILAFIILAPTIPVVLFGLAASSNIRAFFGMNILAFGGIFMAFYLVHLSGIFPGY
jgi:hypothetical protein